MQIKYIPKELWSDKNNSSCDEYSIWDRRKFLWKCENGIHEDFIRSIFSSTSKNFTCPKCNREKARRKKVENLIGKKINRLTVLYIDEEKTREKHKTYWICKCECGNTKSINHNQIISGHTKSCGCYWKEQTSGENSHYWKGGVFDKNKHPRLTSEYNEWRKAVYKKDWYTCQCCGKSTDIEKQAHHFYNFSDNENIRFDINNGITLCKHCHYSTVKGSFHHIYGTTNNTPEQLEEYINFKRKQLGINIPFSITEYFNGNILKPNSI